MDTTFELLLCIAAVLFCVAGVMRLMSRSFDGALIAFGLALFAFAPVIV